MLADLDDPRPSRAPGLVIGLAVGLVVVIAVAVGLLPALVAMVMGGARDFDEKLREQDAYMQELCTTAMVLPRDEQLCQCALATEFPSLDCQGPFRRWRLARQASRCDVDALRATAVSYCACVEAVSEAVADAPDDDEARRAAQAHDRCVELEDHPGLPELVALTPPASP